MKLLEMLWRPRRPEPIPPIAEGPVELGFRSVARSHVGTVRELNEDRFVDFPQHGLWAVADGMGGHHAGDVAAQMLVDGLSEIAGSAATDAATISDAVDRVNGALVGRATPELGTSGSTLIALLAQGASYTCMWAGDSRAYLYRGGFCRPISRDHSLVQEMVDEGLLLAIDAKGHPHANIITRAVGVSNVLELEATCGEVKPGDIFLLCSDGLIGAVDEDRIEDMLGGAGLDAIADSLLAASLARGASDNVTFVLVETFNRAASN